MSELLLRMSTLSKSSSQRCFHQPHQKVIESCCCFPGALVIPNKFRIGDRKGYEKDSPHVLSVVCQCASRWPSFWLSGSWPQWRPHSHAYPHCYAGQFAERKPHHLHDAGKPLL